MQNTVNSKSIMSIPQVEYCVCVLKLDTQGENLFNSSALQDNVLSLTALYTTFRRNYGRSTCHKNSTILCLCHRDLYVSVLLVSWAAEDPQENIFKSSPAGQGFTSASRNTFDCLLLFLSDFPHKHVESIINKVS